MATAQPLIRVALVEDDAGYRQSLELLFSTEPGFSLAASFPDGSDCLAAMAAFEDCPWDVVFMDVDMPTSGIVTTKALRQPRVARTVLDLMRQQSWSVPAPSDVDLTRRQREVLSRLTDGLSYKEIAADLDVSIDTVRTHIRGLYQKLQVHSVAEAVSRALRERLV